VCGKFHRNQCHVCPHVGDVRAGKYSNTPWKKTPCSGCVFGGDGGAVNHKGRVHESLDSDKGHSVDVRRVVAETFASDDSQQVENPLEEFVQFLIELAQLDPRARDVAMLRTLHLLGRESWGYERIAQRLRISTQAAHQIHRRALEQSAVLRRVFAWQRASQSEPEV